ncbi:MAG: TonB-dependent receptor [Gemmatimonadota bacterium]
MKVASSVRRFSGAALAALFLFAAAPLAAQEPAVVTGTVTDASTAGAVSGASVSIVGTNRTAVTGASGSYQLRVRPGSYTLRVTLIGFAPQEQAVTVSADQANTADFALVSQALVIGDELVAIGSRTARTATETPVPIDVITAAEIRESGHTEVNQILREIVPSFNASHQTISDGTDHVNPASLRGLGPDQVLVLVNGKRRHTSAIVHVNGTFGRGTVGVDMNAIPTSAIERIEVLRDGASAQYGSDAIAGVINVVLKEQTESLQATATAGLTGGCLTNESDPSGNPLNIDWDCDGEQVDVGVNFGFPIADEGFFNVTGRFLNRERTNRSGLEMKDQFLGISGVAATDAEIAARGLTRADFSMQTGQGEAVVGMAFFNSAFPVGEDAELYAFGGLSRRDGFATGFFRRANEENKTILSLHPNGFLPEIVTGINDGSVTVGLRGQEAGWDLDLSVTRGTNSFLFNIENTNNASMGAASPVSFDAGTLSFRQTTGNVDAVRLLDTGDEIKSLSLVLGGEFRVENYEIGAGQFESFSLGNGGPVPGVDFDTTSAGAAKNPGSQVFTGFQPANEVNRTRNSISAYAGLEMEINDQVLLDIGGRYENYTDFGSTVNGKIAARIEAAPNFAIRGAVSTGFRAPSLHQAWFNNISTQFVLDTGGNLVARQVLTANNLSGVATAFGVPNLKEETSVNVSGGFTARPTPNFSLTADVYFITIDDRIVLTSRFGNSDPTVAGILAPFAASGVAEAQFFSNAVDTETFGVDIVASYAANLDNGGRLTLTGSANITDTDVTAINTPASMQAIFGSTDITGTLFNREERNRLEDALPRQKGSLTVKYDKNRFGLIVRGNYFGKVEYKPTNDANDETFDAKTIFDLDLAYEISEGVRWSIGANNLLNTYPDQHELSGNRSDERFVFSRRVTQFGSNGGFYYSRIQLDL